MRLLLTAVAGGVPHDIAVDVDQDGTVGDLEAALTEQFPQVRPVAGARMLRAVPAAGLPTPDPGPQAPPEPLYLGSERLDPKFALQASDIRHGSIVGVGAPVGDPLTEPSGLVELRVSGGEDAGRVVRWEPGEYTVGGDDSCDLVLQDSALAGVVVSVLVDTTGAVFVDTNPAARGRLRELGRRRRPLPGPIVLHTHETTAPAKPTKRVRRGRRRPAGVERVLPEGTQTVDANEPSPLVHLERRVLRELTEWRNDETLSVGGVLVHLATTTPPDASLSLSPAGATQDYNRPPRLLPPERETKFTLPPEPEMGERPPFPLMMMMLPAMMGVGMYLFTKSPYALMFIAFSPLMALGSYTTQIRMNKRRFIKDMAKWTDRMKRIQSDALDALVEERTARRRDFADPGEVLMTAIGPRARLWERRPTDPDWLEARMGTADQISDIQITDPERESHEGPVQWTAPDVPVTVSLAKAGVTGIAGERSARLALARWVVAQTATLQSPTQASMVLMTDVRSQDDWSWVRWLPHLRSDPDDSELAHLGVDEQTWSRRIGELNQQIAQRVAASKERGGFSGARGGLGGPPILVILDGSRALRLIPGMVTLLQEGPDVGIYFLCLDDDPRLLPEECQAVVAVGRDLDGEVLATVTQTNKAAIEQVRLDLVTAAWAERLARALAPVRDVTDSDESTSLPGSSRLLDVLGLDVTGAQGVIQRWQQVGRTTQAVIGEGHDGAFAIDIRRDGPHGLVAGTTGSGKSEFLQSLIASLAAHNRPDEMNFVLVDYKGGAAFKDCNKLPHTVGMVTDLDGHLTTRALDSLGAELRRREHQLAGADAKDIEDYLATMTPDSEPMPRLLIVIDEFAALVAELPDFVTGLVDIARRGRSLGVHLILATQRPAGVVNAEIKSNTNLRIALRVTDPADSDDVLESPVAAHISKSTPGRAYARLGHSNLIAFQSSRVGGRPRGEDTTAAIGLRRMEFAELGTSVESAMTEAEEDVSIPTDLAAFVVAANEASAATGVHAPPPPWLPALPDQVTLDQVLEQFPASVPTHDELSLPFGLADIPREQRRDVASYHLARDGHLSVVGASRSGRSYVLRAIAGAVGRLIDPRDVHVYGVDCGNNALLPLVGLPHTGAVVTRDQTDRMARLVRRLQETISQRQQQLAIEGFADIAEQRASVAEADRLPFLLVLFDRWEGFFQAYDGLDGGRLVDAWTQILQEGAGVGVKVVMTGDRTLTVGRISTLFEDKLMLRMLDPQDMSSIGMLAKQVPSHMADGRGFRVDGLREVQVVLHDKDPAGTAQVAQLHKIAREAKARHEAAGALARPFRVDVLPPRITMADARALGDELPGTVLPVAVGGDTLSLRGLDALRHGPGLLVTGGRGTGRSTTLQTMAEFQLAAGWQVVLITPRVSPLRHLAGRPGVHGHFALDSDRDELTTLLEKVRADERPSLTLVDDLELIDTDHWLSDLIEAQLDALRDSGSVLVAAASPAEVSSSYRGPAAVLKRSGSGVMLAPTSSSDSDMFSVMVPRSAYGAAYPPGGGFLVRSGQAERIQVLMPDPVNQG